MTLLRISLAVAALVAAWRLDSCIAADSADAGQAAARSFDEQIAPLLARRCLQCHNGVDKKGGLDLTRPEAALAGGESGVAIVAGKPEESNLWQRVASDEMPPKKPLAAEEKQLLSAWIASGA